MRSRTTAILTLTALGLLSGCTEQRTAQPDLELTSLVQRGWGLCREGDRVYWVRPDGSAVVWSEAGGSEWPTQREQRMIDRYQGRDPR